MVMPKFTIGCDPELFVCNKETGAFVSAWGMIPGTKDKPHPVKGGAIQVDGNAVEFNINPATSLTEWNDNIASVREALAAAIPDGHELVIKPTADFDPVYFASLPDEAKELGCVPDLCAYTEAENPRPNGNPPFRTASGHIHVGWTSGKDTEDPDHKADCFEVVKQLDFYIGLPSLIWDKDRRRRSMYGKAGAMRVKPYGVEYRTPSNMWLDDPVSQKYMYNASVIALQDLFDGAAVRTRYGEHWAQSYIDAPTSAINREVISAIRNASQRVSHECDLIGLYDHFKKKNMVQPKLKLGELPKGDLIGPQGKRAPLQFIADMAGPVAILPNADRDFIWHGRWLGELDVVDLLQARRWLRGQPMNPDVMRGLDQIQNERQRRDQINAAREFGVEVRAR